MKATHGPVVFRPHAGSLTVVPSLSRPERAAHTGGRGGGLPARDREIVAETVAAADRRSDILAEQLHAVTGIGGVSLIPQILAAFLLVLALRHGVEGSLLIGWFAGFTAVVMLRALFLLAYVRAQPGGEALPRWAHGFTLTTTVIGGAWGAAPLLFYLAIDGPSQSLLTMILVGLTAGSIATTTPHLPANVGYVLPILVPLIVQTARVGDPVHVITAVLLAVYLGFVLFCARRMNRLLATSLAIRYENVDLIRELREQKTAAEAARQAAEAANRAKSQFLAAASHDLRQPLHALGLFAGALRERIHYPEVRHIVDNINASVGALEALFNELLDISRLDAGAVTPNPVTFRMQQVFDRLATDFDPLAAEQGLTLRFVATRLRVHTDPVLIERVLRNLVANALRYTQRGGVVVGLRRAGAGLRLEVWDSGVGIPAAEQERVFEEFYQIGNPERDRARGLGLGLAIVRRLTRILGHRLEMASRLGKGTSFRVYLPRGQAGAETNPAHSPAMPDSARLRGRHVVLIDDEPAVRDGMAALLLQWGCGVVTAGSLEEALPLLRRAPDLAIADYRLRDGAVGADALRALQARFGADMPAILITGDTAPDRIREAKASGYHLLHKPVPPNRLKVLMAYLIGVREKAASGG